MVFFLEIVILILPLVVYVKIVNKPWYHQGNKPWYHQGNDSKFEPLWQIGPKFQVKVEKSK